MKRTQYQRRYVSEAVDEKLLKQLVAALVAYSKLPEHNIDLFTHPSIGRNLRNAIFLVNRDFVANKKNPDLKKAISALKDALEKDEAGSSSMKIDWAMKAATKLAQSGKAQFDRDVE